jgi:lipopolysaccharide export system permease protein
MFKLSKVIAQEWFKALIGAIIVLFLLVSIGDIINGFLRNYELKRIIIEYFLKLPDLTGKMLPISALLASLFAINKLKTHSELMAILAGGYSAEKIYKIVLFCSLSVGILQIFNLGFILPSANFIKRQEFEKSRKNESKYLARSKIGKTGLIWYKTDSYFASFKAFDPQNNLLKEVSLYTISPQGKLESIYKAKEAIHIEGNKWKLVEIITLNNLEDQSFPKHSESGEFIIELKEEPDDFSQFESDITTLNFFELGAFIERLEETEINSTEYKIMYFEKISLALICIVFSLFPVSGVFNPNRRAAGFGKSVVFTLLFSIFFWGLHTGMVSLGNSAKIPVILATMGIPTIFSLYILFIFLKNRSL